MRKTLAAASLALSVLLVLLLGNAERHRISGWLDRHKAAKVYLAHRHTPTTMSLQPTILDTFTGTNGTPLTVHVADTGTAWTQTRLSAGSVPALSAGQLAVAATQGGQFVTGPYAGADDSVAVEFTAATPPTEGPVVSATNTDFTGYIAAYNVGLGGWNIFRFLSGVNTTLGSGVAVGTEYLTTDSNVARLARSTSGGVATLRLTVNGVVVRTATDSSPLAGTYAGIYADSSQGATPAPLDNFRVWPSSAELLVVMVGDSITAGITSQGPQDRPPSVHLGGAMSRGAAGLPVRVIDNGVSATTTADWMPGGSYLPGTLATIQAAATAGQTVVVSLMLGTNDCKTATRISVAQYTSNLTAIVNALTSAGATVVLHRSPYAVAGAIGGANTWDAAASTTYLPAYWAANVALANGSTVKLGDQQFWADSSANPSGVLLDGVHPTAAYNRTMGQNWGAALTQAVLPPSVAPTATATSTGATLTANATGGTAPLTYAWSITSKPAGATAALSNSAVANPTLTASTAGSYTASLSVTDAASNTATGTVTFTVAQALTSIALTPSAVALHEQATQQFTANALDQFGNAMTSQPTMAWSKAAGVGTVTTGGLYTAPGSNGVGSGTATVAASSGGVTGTATVTVSDAAPTVATPATASPSTVTVTTAALTVLGADDGGEAGLTYGWAATAKPAGAAPAFSATGANGAKASTVTFDRAGSYTLTATITDAEGLTASSSVAVTVQQAAAALSVAPAFPVVAQGGTQAFTASGTDQFGQPTTPTGVTWSVAGTGSVNSATGVYTAGASAGAATVTATVAGGVKASTALAVSAAAQSVPPAADVLAGVAVGSGVGTLVLPAPADVRLGTTYGVGGNGSTGSMVATGGGITLDQLNAALAPANADLDDLVAASVTVTGAAQ